MIVGMNEIRVDDNLEYRNLKNKKVLPSWITKRDFLCLYQNLDQNEKSKLQYTNLFLPIIFIYDRLFAVTGAFRF